MNTFIFGCLIILSAIPSDVITDWLENNIYSKKTELQVIFEHIN